MYVRISQSNKDAHLYCSPVYFKLKDIGECYITQSFGSLPNAYFFLVCKVDVAQGLELGYSTLVAHLLPREVTGVDFHCRDAGTHDKLF